MAESGYVVYRLHGHDGELLYVGSTRQFSLRLAQHRHGKVWFPLVESWTVEAFSDRAAALQAEKAAILSESPVFNCMDGGHRLQLKKTSGWALWDPAAA